MAWGLLSQSSCFFYFPFPKPRVTLAQPWFTFLLSLLGAPWSKGQSRPQRSTGETEPRPWPNPVPRDLEDHSSGHLPQTPAESLQPATWVFLVWLLTQAVSGKGQFKHSLSSSFSPHCGVGHFRIQRKLCSCVYAHGHSESPIFSRYQERDPCTHVSMWFWGLTTLDVQPCGEDLT